MQGLCEAAGPLGEGGPQWGASGTGQAGEGTAVHGLPPAHDHRLLGSHSGVPMVLQPAPCQQVNQPTAALGHALCTTLSIDAVYQPQLSCANCPRMARITFYASCHVLQGSTQCLVLQGSRLTSSCDTRQGILAFTSMYCNAMAQEVIQRQLLRRHAQFVA